MPKRFRPAFLSTFGTAATAAAGASAAAAALLMCGNPPPPSMGDSGAQPSVCPTAAPLDGGACDASPTATCEYGGNCSEAVAHCISGTWSTMVTNTVTASCPDAQPAGGDLCCAPSSLVCTYGTCASPTGATKISCQNGAWEFAGRILSCDAGAEAAADAGTDASTD